MNTKLLKTFYTKVLEYKRNYLLWKGGCGWGSKQNEVKNHWSTRNFSQINKLIDLYLKHAKYRSTHRDWGGGGTHEPSVPPRQYPHCYGMYWALRCHFRAKGDSLSHMLPVLARIHNIRSSMYLDTSTVNASLFVQCIRKGHGEMYISNSLWSLITLHFFISSLNNFHSLSYRCC